METMHISGVTGGTELADATVICRVLAGETLLYELLMRRHNQKLYRAIRSYLKDEQEVKDAMQDTYLKAYEKLSQFRNDAQFSTWLIRIGINVSLAKLREHKRLFPVSLLTDRPEDLTEGLTLINYMSPEKITIQQEARQLLEKAIDSIPENYRVIYNLREVEGLPMRDICQALDLTESNVKVRLHRAKAMLKEKLLALSENQHVFEFGNKRCDALVEHVMQILSEKKKP